MHNIICHFGCKCDLLKLTSIIRKEQATKLYLKASKYKDHKLSPLIPNILQTTRKNNQPSCVSERKKKCFVRCTTEIINKLL